MTSPSAERLFRNNETEEKAKRCRMPKPKPFRNRPTIAASPEDLPVDLRDSCLVERPWKGVLRAAKQKRHSVDLVIGKVHQVDVELGQGEAGPGRFPRTGDYGANLLRVAPSALLVIVINVLNRFSFWRASTVLCSPLTSRYRTTTSRTSAPTRCRARNRVTPAIRSATSTIDWRRGSRKVDNSHLTSSVPGSGILRQSWPGTNQHFAKAIRNPVQHPAGSHRVLWELPRSLSEHYGTRGWTRTPSEPTLQSRSP